jgi:hypothetical protein
MSPGLPTRSLRFMMMHLRRGTSPYIESAFKCRARSMTSACICSSARELARPQDMKTRENFPTDSHARRLSIRQCLLDRWSIPRSNLMFQGPEARCTRRCGESHGPSTSAAEPSRANEAPNARCGSTESVSVRSKHSRCISVCLSDNFKVYTHPLANLNHYNSVSLSLGSPRSSTIEPIGGCCDSDSSSLGSPRSSMILD